MSAGWDSTSSMRMEVGSRSTRACSGRRSPGCPGCGPPSGQFDLRHPGRYILRISGIGSTPSDNRVVFARPVGGAMVGYILALVGLGLMTIASVVGSLLLILLPHMKPPR